MKKKKIAYFANTDWYLYNFRLPLINELHNSSYELFLLSPPGPYGQKLKDLGFNWSPIDLDRGSLNIFKEIRAIFQLRRFILNKKIDLVHGFTMKCSVYSSLASVLTNISNIFSITGMGYVFTSRDLKAKFLKPFVWLALKLTLNREYSQLILQNPDDVNFFISSNIVPQDKISLIPSSGVDCEKFSPSNNKSEFSRFRVLLSARLLWDKGIDTYVESAKILHAEGYKIEFYLAGRIDKENPSSIPIETVNRWVSQGYIKYLGHVEDMPALLQSIHLSVLPSAREGLPKSLIEALACGIPIISSDVPGCREVVEEGMNGFLVPFGDKTKLKDAIKFFLIYPEKYLQFSEQSRSSALNRYDAKIVNSSTKKLYEDLLTKLK